MQYPLTVESCRKRKDGRYSIMFEESNIIGLSDHQMAIGQMYMVTLEGKGRVCEIVRYLQFDPERDDFKFA